LNAINKFFTSYAKTERMWNDLSVIPIFEYKINTKEMDKIIFTPIDQLRMNILELQIYFPEKEHKIFKDILKNVLKINGKLNSIYFNYDKETTVTVKSNNFSFVKDSKLEENEKLLEKLSEIIRKTFN
jgi:hypothetical protein